MRDLTDEEGLRWKVQIKETILSLSLTTTPELFEVRLVFVAIMLRCLTGSYNPVPRVSGAPKMSSLPGSWPGSSGCGVSPKLTRVTDPRKGKISSFGLVVRIEQDILAQRVFEAETYKLYRRR